MDERNFHAKQDEGQTGRRMSSRLKRKNMTADDASNECPEKIKPAHRDDDDTSITKGPTLRRRNVRAKDEEKEMGVSVAMTRQLKNRGSLDQNKETISKQKVAKRPLKQMKLSIKKGQGVVISREADSDCSFSKKSDLSSDDDHLEKDVKAKKRKLRKQSNRKKFKRVETNTERERISDSHLSCPHCQKVVASITALKYHIDNYVCRKDDLPESMKKVSSPKPSSGVKRKAKSRFRGQEKDRTCPKCNKVFTSSLGKEYHVNNSVCSDNPVAALPNKSAFPTLKSGSQYITKFGIVEVMTDNRETPKYVYPQDFKAKFKTYCNYKDKIMAYRRRQYLDIAYYHRLRRNRLRRAYDLRDVRGPTVWKAYFGTNECPSAYEKPPTYEPRIQQNPVLAPDAFPDRIVVCKLIPDERNHFFSLDRPSVNSKLSFHCSERITLYLRRSDLAKVYNKTAEVYVCPDCGVKFTSRDGFGYHLQEIVCTKKAQSHATQRQDVIEAAQARLDRHLSRNTARHHRLQKRREADRSIYPQVWQCLGFSLPAVVKAPNVMEKGDSANIELRVRELDNTLNNLREKIRKKALEEIRSAMYKSVFKSLGFRKPKVTSQSSDGINEEPPSAKRRKKRNAEQELEADGANLLNNESSQPPVVNPHPVPPIPIVDIQVLIDEVKSGRYPSIQRYNGDYPDECLICREGGELYLCDFCSNAVHLTCILTKIIIKEPEADEGFMCHCCARKVMSRRSRAERRRQQKKESVLEKARKKAAERAVSEEHCGDMNLENDYHAAAAVGKELSELIELLGDARKTLHQMLEVSKVNDLRRLQLGL